MNLDLAVIMVQCTPPGLTLHLNGYTSIPTDGSGRILITDIGLVDASALICQSDVATAAGNANWYLHPTQLSTAEGNRIQSTDPRGWSKNRGTDSNGHRLVRLKRHSITHCGLCCVSILKQSLSDPLPVAIFLSYNH